MPPRKRSASAIVPKPKRKRPGRPPGKTPNTKPAGNLPAPRKLLGAKSHKENADKLRRLQALLVRHGFDDEQMIAALAVEFGKEGAKTTYSPEASKHASDAAIRAKLASIERRGSLDHYVLYVMQQSQLVRDLQTVKDAVITEAATKDRQAFIQASKAQSDIYDKVLKAGIDFRVIDQRPKKSDTVRGIPALRLGSPEVALALRQEITLLASLVDEAHLGSIRTARATDPVDRATLSTLNTATDIAEASLGPTTEDLPTLGPSTPKNVSSLAQRRLAMQRLYVHGELVHDIVTGQAEHSFPTLVQVAIRFGFSNRTIEDLSARLGWRAKRKAQITMLDQRRVDAHAETELHVHDSENDNPQTNRPKPQGGAGLPSDSNSPPKPPKPPRRSPVPYSAAELAKIDPGAALTARRRALSVELEDRILAALAPAVGKSARLAALSSRDMMERLGIQPQRLRGRLESLLAQGRVRRIDRRWALPELEPDVTVDSSGHSTGLEPETPNSA